MFQSLVFGKKKREKKQRNKNHQRVSSTFDKTFHLSINNHENDELFILIKKQILEAWRHLHFHDPILKIDTNCPLKRNICLMFNDIDQDIDGLVTKSEVRAWTSKQRTRFMGGLNVELVDEEIDAFFAKGASADMSVLTEISIRHCLDSYPQLDFDWDDPLNNNIDPQIMKENVMTQISTIFSRMDTDNDGKIHPHDIRLWRKLVYFGRPEDILIYMLIEDVDDEDVNYDEISEFEREKLYVTFDRFINILLKDFLLFSELLLQSYFIGVIFQNVKEIQSDNNSIPPMNLPEQASTATSVASSTTAPPSRLISEKKKKMDSFIEDSLKDNNEFVLSDSNILKEYLVYTFIAKLKLIRIGTVMNPLELRKRRSSHSKMDINQLPSQRTSDLHLDDNYYHHHHHEDLKEDNEQDDDDEQGERVRDIQGGRHRSNSSFSSQHRKFSHQSSSAAALLSMNEDEEYALISEHQNSKVEHVSHRLAAKLFKILDSNRKGYVIVDDIERYSLHLPHSICFYASLLATPPSIPFSYKGIW
jgi:Ca2+-binding EF-hand superfamily protein